MARSFLKRTWDVVKPPPAPPPNWRFNRSQRRLIRVTAIVLALGAGSWGIYAYIASAPDRANSHFQRGMMLLGAGDSGGSISQFTTAAGIRPEYAEAYVGRGKAEEALGQNDAALADFERAIAIDPTLDTAYAYRGMLWHSRGDLSKALADFTQSIRIQPSPDAYYQRGLAFQALGEPQRAVNDYDLAIVRDPAVPHLYRARAKAKLDLKDPAGAKQDQETAERLEKTQ